MGPSSQDTSGESCPELRGDCGVKNQFVQFRNLFTLIGKTLKTNYPMDFELVG